MSNNSNNTCKQTCNHSHSIAFMASMLFRGCVAVFLPAVFVAFMAVFLPAVFSPFMAFMVFIAPTAFTAFMSRLASVPFEPAVLPVCGVTPCCSECLARSFANQCYKVVLE